MLVDCTPLRQGGIRLRSDELTPAVRGHLRIERGTARLTFDPTSPITVGDVVPPLMEVRLYRLQGADLVLHGEEHTAAGMVVLRQPQAWWCTVVGPQSPDRPVQGSAA
jgi:hypothetical protein